MESSWQQRLQAFLGILEAREFKPAGGDGFENPLTKLGLLTLKSTACVIGEAFFLSEATLTGDDKLNIIPVPPPAVEAPAVAPPVAHPPSAVEAPAQVPPWIPQTSSSHCTQ